MNDIGYIKSEDFIKYKAVLNKFTGNIAINENYITFINLSEESLIKINIPLYNNKETYKFFDCTFKSEKIDWSISTEDLNLYINNNTIEVYSHYMIASVNINYKSNKPKFIEEPIINQFDLKSIKEIKKKNWNINKDKDFTIEPNTRYYTFIIKDNLTVITSNNILYSVIEYPINYNFNTTFKIHYKLIDLISKEDKINIKLSKNFIYIDTENYHIITNNSPVYFSKEMLYKFNYTDKDVIDNLDFNNFPKDKIKDNRSKVEILPGKINYYFSDNLLYSSNTSYKGKPLYFMIYNLYKLKLKELNIEYIDNNYPVLINNQHLIMPCRFIN